MGDNSISTNRRHQMTKFSRSMQVVRHLNRRIEVILQRYNNVREDVHPAHVSALHRRLLTLEGVRSLYLKYARQQMARYGDSSSSLEAVIVEDVADHGTEASESYQTSESETDTSFGDDDKQSDCVPGSDRLESSVLPASDTSTESDTKQGHMDYHSSADILISQKLGLEEAADVFVEKCDGPDSVSSSSTGANSDDDSDVCVDTLQEDVEYLDISSEGETTLDDLSDEEIDTFSAQDMFNWRV